MQNSRAEVKANNPDVEEVTNSSQTESKSLSERGMNLITSQAFRQKTAPLLNNKDFCRFFFCVSKKVSDCEGNNWIKDKRERRRKEYEEDLFYSSLNMVEIIQGREQRLLAFNCRGSYWISKSPDSKEIIIKPFEAIKEPLKTAFVVRGYKNISNSLVCLTYTGKVFIVYRNTSPIKLDLPPVVQISPLNKDNGSILILTKEKSVFKYTLMGAYHPPYGPNILSIDPKMGGVIKLVDSSGDSASLITRCGIYRPSFTPNQSNALIPLCGVQEVFSGYDGEKHFHMLNGDVLHANNLDKRPIKIDNLPPVKKLFSGRFYMIAVTVDGRAFRWGDNSFGQLGSMDRKLEQPQEFKGLQGQVIHACTQRTCSFIFTRSEKGFHTYVFGLQHSLSVNYTGSLIKREDIPTTPYELMLPAELTAPLSEEEMKAFLAHYTPKEVLPFSKELDDKFKTFSFPNESASHIEELDDKFKTFSFSNESASHIEDSEDDSVDVERKGPCRCSLM